ncbi:hypothetical protein ACT3TC_00190 [Halomonas sp. AOP27-A1-41]|uniref:hypothetical protein n=1 Tax=Halomonas sp. AOP27-A1-41 TaxID=3457707 RepID=UPI004034467A
MVTRREERTARHPREAAVRRPLGTSFALAPLRGAPAGGGGTTPMGTSCILAPLRGALAGALRLPRATNSPNALIIWV